MEGTIDEVFLRDALARYVAIDSRNPAFSGGASGESKLAREVAGDLEEVGLETTLVEAPEGRHSVVGRLPGSRSGAAPSLMIYAHLDTVGVEGMDDPFAATVRDGRLYGRGSYDMKGGLASCVAVARTLATHGPRLAGDLVVVGAADEETESRGMQAVLREIRTDAAVNTEPTDLDVCLAHKGFAWFRITTHGRAAHGSRYEEGVDANLHMGRVLGLLADLERELREDRPPHPLVGQPSLHAATLAGGTGLSTYADRCVLEVERRTIPSETPALAHDELRRILDRLATADPAFRAECDLLLAREPFEAREGSAVVGALSRAWEESRGTAPIPVGGTYWMDAALMSAAGIDTVVFGPSGAGAHSAEEWVDLASLETHAAILLATAIAYCG